MFVQIVTMVTAFQVHYPISCFVNGEAIPTVSNSHQPMNTFEITAFNNSFNAIFFSFSRLAYSSGLGGSLPHFKASFRPPAYSQNLPLSIKIWSACVYGLDSMQLAWQSINYHDHSSLSCPLISWGSVKTETLPALCNKNNKPIDLIHLRCGWQITLLRYAWCLRKMLPTKLCLKKMCLSQTCTLSKTDGDWDCHTKMCEKGQIKLNAS